MTEIQGSHQLQAHRDRIWRSLNDPQALQYCISACQSMDRIDQHRFQARFGVSLGPLRIGVGAHLTVHPVEPPRHYQLICSVTSRIAGGAKGRADVHLEIVTDEITRVHYTGEVALRGGLARYADELVQTAANKRMAQFFERFQDWMDMDRATD